jgi:hypothetical protein
MNECIAYSEIKTVLLSTYWRGCAGGSFSGWTHRQVCSWSYAEFDGAYDHPSEYFMLELISLVMVGNWYPDLAEYHKRQMHDLMSRPGFDDDVQAMPMEELEQLVADLKTVGLSLGFLASGTSLGCLENL